MGYCGSIHMAKPQSEEHLARTLINLQMTLLPSVLFLILIFYLLQEYAENVNLLGYEIFLRCIQTKTSRDCSDTSWRRITEAYASNTKLTIPDLPTWTMYRIEIKAFNSAGSSPANIFNVTTKEMGWFC